METSCCGGNGGCGVDIGGCCGDNNAYSSEEYFMSCEETRQDTISQFMNQFNLSEEDFEKYLIKDAGVNEIILLERLRKISFEISDDLLDLPHVFANEELYSEIFQLHSKFNSLYNTLLEKYLIEAEEKARKEDENASV